MTSFFGYRTLAVAAVLLATAITQSQAEKRVALVVGNSAYQNVPTLANPVNDAEALAELLKKSGFEVIYRANLGNLAFKRSLREFTFAAREADIALVYFAGHGMEVKGTNFLVPTDAKLATDYDAEDEAVSLNRIIDAVEPAKQLRLIILDACRDNPFGKSMQRTVSSRAASVGLAKVEPAASNFLIAFAAKAGSTANDGNGTHSPFTSALLMHIATPGLEVGKVFRRVRDEVLKATRNRQEPFVYSSLGSDDIALVPAPPATERTAASDVRRDYELAAQVGTKAAWDSFLALYPAGFFSDLARGQQQKLIAATAGTPGREPASPDDQRVTRENVKRGDDIQAETQSLKLAKQKQEHDPAAESEKKVKVGDLSESGNPQTAVVPPSVQSPKQQPPSADDCVDEAKQLKRLIARGSKSKHELAQFADHAKCAETRTHARERLASLEDASAHTPKNGDVPSGNFDGTWKIAWKADTGRCRLDSDGTYMMAVLNGKFTNGRSGIVSSSGNAHWLVISRWGTLVTYTGKLQGNSGSGRFHNERRCRGTFTASR